MINLSKKVRASITFKDLGAQVVFSYETKSLEVIRHVAVCADIKGETWPIWFIETLGM